MDVYLRKHFSFPETLVLPPRESHEIFIKTKSVITTRIIPRGLDPREIATPLFHSTPASAVSLSLSFAIQPERELVSSRATCDSGHGVTSG